jgi:periplasmic divalent cation tolerance protein
MKIYYITLNTPDEAKRISYSLLERKHAVCTNWFPMTCAYRWEGGIKEEPEIVLIVKTQNGKRDDIEKVIAEHITYNNFIGELDVHSINHGFLNWLNKDVPL